MTLQTVAGGARTYVFDCDGVLLDSNRVKTEAFRAVALRYGEEAAQALVDFHVRNGGVSRYRKFAYLLSEILGLPAPEDEVAILADAYGDLVFKQLLSCRVAAGLTRLRNASGTARWMVVSGGAENELRRVFAARGLDSLFDGGIYGSPATKDELLASLLADGTLERPALFLGDSRYDHEAASRAGLSFVFVSGWTEFQGWREYCQQHVLPVISSLEDGATLFEASD